MSETLRAPTVHSVASLGKLRLQGAWRVELLHAEARNRLYWITRGQGRVSIKCVTRGYGPNTAIFVPANVPMALELASQTQGLQLCLPSDLGLHLPKEPFQMRVSGIESQATITSHIEKIEGELSARAPAMDTALDAYSLLVSTWMARELSFHDAPGDTAPRTVLKGGAAPEKSHRLVELFAERMEAQFRNGTGVAALARQLHVTPTHLSRVCREASGRPALALLNERIMYEARRLLLETDLPAREVALQLGFSSAAYFTRAFNQAVGRTPSEFRKPVQRA